MVRRGTGTGAAERIGSRVFVRPVVNWRRLRATLCGSAGLLVAFVAGEARAQQAIETCPQGRITQIFVDAHSVFDLTDPDLNGRYRWAYRLANRLHVPTREEVIRREIVIEEGDCYDVELLRDSERMLRSLAFIADVDIFGVRQPGGGIHVIVDTQDEWSTRIQPKVGTGGISGLTGLRLREDNLFGTGQHVAAFFQSDEERQVYGLAYHTPQLLGTRWDGHVEAGRTPVGYLVNQSISYPFVGEVGGWALRQAIFRHDRFFEYLVPAGDELVALWYPERRQSFDVGGAFRWGEQGYNRTLLGAALAGEWVSYPAEARFADSLSWNAGGLMKVPEIRNDSVASIRAMFLTGQRNVYFVRRRALDTVNGTEDVRLGVETELALGPSLRGLSKDRDLAADFGFFAGGELLEATIAGAHFLVEGRRNYETSADESEWRDVFAQLNGWIYWRPSAESRHTIVGSIAAAGGWHDGVPFQLTLGGETGLRGYRKHVYPGGRRIVGSVEHRSYLGWPLPSLLDLGAVTFFDVGKMWPGDVPFGVESPVRMNVGAGLRAAFPAGSRQTFRVDLGVPLYRGVGFRDLVLQAGVGQAIGRRAARRDPQLGRSARQGVSTSTFTFPLGR